MGGYETPMATALTDLRTEMAVAEEAARNAGMNFLPKAIYVCRTNIVEGDALRRDDPKRPFERREAPPILIWRFLTEQAGVSPEEIAVYCDLDFDRSFPPPDEFVHYRGGDRDWDEFSRSRARHIIFNQALQEGWDDPTCYFAYIDKTMGSKTEVEQVIGRVLRQPGAEHYSDDILNTAHFFVRVDARGVFREIVDKVRDRLSKDNVPINVRTRQAGRSDGTQLLTPKKERTGPVITADPTDALEPIKALVDGLSDYSGGGPNTRGAGARAMIRQRIGEVSNEELQWVEAATNSSVLARWIFERAVMRGHPDALDVAPSDDSKFDARVELGSRAQIHIQDIADRVVDAYLTHIRLRYDRRNPWTVGSVRVKTTDRIAFTNALHEAYSDLNELERGIAQAIDRTRHAWCRNPSQTGYWIPLISRGSTRRFFPDFLVWKGNDLFAIDTNGDHLLVERTGRKLLTVTGTGPRVYVRLLSAGRWTLEVKKTDKNGYTTWSLREDGTLAARWFENGAAAIQDCLRAE